MTSNDTKVVLVTGGSSGIGAGIAKGFSKQGVCLSLVALATESFDEVVKECKDLGAKEVLKIVTDLTLKENMEMVMKKTIDTFGRLDVLVNCAGILVFGSIREVTLEEFDKAFSIHLKTPMYMTQLSIPYLEKTKGNIVNISSSTTSMNLNVVLIYTLSKVALNRLTKMTALDLASSGIRVNAVIANACNTPLFQAFAKLSGVTTEAAQRLEDKNQPLNERMVEIDEVVDAVLFIASDQAKMITGTNLPVDGGRALTGK